VAAVAGASVLEELIPALRSSLGRLERLLMTAPHSPIAELRLATLLRSQAALLSALAGELGGRAYEDLGRFGAEAVEAACKAADAETSACQVADAFLRLWRYDQR
jgi:hypothetical protein